MFGLLDLQLDLFEDHNTLAAAFIAKICHLIICATLFSPYLLDIALGVPEIAPSKIIDLTPTVIERAGFHQANQLVKGLETLVFDLIW